MQEFQKFHELFYTLEDKMVKLINSKIYYLNSYKNKIFKFI